MPAVHDGMDEVALIAQCGRVILFQTRGGNMPLLACGRPSRLFLSTLKWNQVTMLLKPAIQSHMRMLVSAVNSTLPLPI